ncbi:MAG: hypothetical protein LKM40_00965 [Mageeibacillus sp.]|jgi:hypothetical protein|nr:hypothetical protein [Mageeibacillus sp.]
MTKMYNIVDMQGNFYKIGAKGNLEVARNSDEAAPFSFREANERIGTGKKAHFYSVIEANVQQPQEEPVYSASEYDEVKKPTMFDTLKNDWENTLSNLCYMSSHMEEYQENLKTMLSDVDKEVCDLLHYLELNDLDDGEMLKTSKMLQDARRRRREVKDEMERTAVMRSTFLDKEFGIKVHQGLEQIEHMKGRIYTPRKLADLFDEQPIQRAV